MTVEVEICSRRSARSADHTALIFGKRRVEFRAALLMTSLGVFANGDTEHAVAVTIVRTAIRAQRVAALRTNGTKAPPHDEARSRLRNRTTTVADN